jgi:hypothetical protein
LEGNEKKALLSNIILKIEEITGTYSNLKMTEFFGCNCKECLASEDPFLFETSVINTAIQKKKKSIECSKSLDQVEVGKLLGLYLESDKMKEYMRTEKEPNSTTIIVGRDYIPGKQEGNTTINQVGNTGNTNNAISTNSDKPPTSENKPKHKIWRLVWRIVLGIGVIIPILVGIIKLVEFVQSKNEAVGKTKQDTVQSAPIQILKNDTLKPSANK